MATYRKSDFVKELTKKTGIKRKETLALLDTIFEIACRETKEGGFTFPGLFKIDMTTRKQRRMRNPQTGQAILISEHQAPRIRILKKAKDTITADEPKRVIPLDDPITPPSMPAPAPAAPKFKVPDLVVPPAPAAPESVPEAPAIAPENAPEPVLETPIVEPEPETPEFKVPDLVVPPAPAAPESVPEVPAITPENAPEPVLETPIVEPEPETPETTEPVDETSGGVVYDDFSSAVSFKCKACGGEIEAPAAAAGFTSECPVCGEPVMIPTESEPGTIHGPQIDINSLDNQVEAAAERAFSEASLADQKNQTIRIDLSTLDTNAPEAPKAKPRIVSFFCKNCKQELEAPAEMMGMKSECPDCNASFEVPFFSDPGTLHGSDLEKTDAAKPGNAHNRTIRIEMPDF